jgi:UDP-glucose 4-epimerase
MVKKIKKELIMSILIIGGAGYIGSHVNKLLHKFGYSTLIIDNLCRGHREHIQWGKFIQGDIGNIEFLDHVFTTNKIEAVMHFAAFAYVGESIFQPDIYYENNVSKTLVLLDAMVRHRVNYFVFSSSCATFGNALYTPINELHPQNPINPYGYTKLVVEQILKDYDNAYGLKYCIFRYFNASGADPDARIGEWHDPETHLIPLVLDVAAGIRPKIDILGNDYNTPDGTCIRDYIHVCDLAEAHRLGMELLLKTNTSDHFNLGYGKGYSIQEIIHVVQKITRSPINVNYIVRRDGDPAELVGSSEKAKRILNWVPQFSLEDSITTAWKWHQKTFECLPLKRVG